jgi:hypothetical protein
MDTLHNALSNAKQHHMRMIHSDVYDGRDRPWSHRLRETLETKHAEFVSFLMKPREEFQSSLARSDFLRKLSDTQLNPHASWFDSVYTPDTSHIAVDLETRFTLSDVRTKLDAILVEYKAALIDLFHWDHLITRKLKILDTTYTHMIQMELVESQEAAALQKAVLDYIHHVYDSHHIEAYYENFCKAYARYMALRTVVMPFHSTSALQKTTCSICFESEIGYALDPCGHVFCKDCAHKQSQCYLCRIPIVKRLTLYL